MLADTEENGQVRVTGWCEHAWLVYVQAYVHV